MAITPTAFNVPALSPAALLGNQPQERGFQSAIERAMALAAQQQMQERAFEFTQLLDEQRHERGVEDIFTRGIAEGHIVPLSDAPELPGETYRTIQGVGRYSDTEFVQQRDIQQAQVRALREQPLGDEFLPGTRTEDVYNVLPDGTLQVRSAELERRHLTGDRESVLAGLRVVAENYGRLPGVTDHAQALMRLVEQDEDFSLAEQETFAQFSDPAAMNAYEQSVRMLQRMDQEDRALLSQNRLNINRTYQLATDDRGGRRNLTGAEIMMFGQAATFGRESLSPEQQQMYDTLLPNMTERLSAPEIQDELARGVTAAGTPGMQEFNEFLTWLTAAGWDERGNPTNTALAEEVRAAAEGNDDFAGRQAFARSPVSRKYRTAFMLDQGGWGTRSQVELLRSGGLAFPHGTDGPNGIHAAFETIYGDAYNDIPALPRGVSAPTGGTGPEDEARISQFQQDRDLFSQSVDAMPPVVANAFAGMLRTGSPDEIAETLDANIRQYRAIAARNNDARYAQLADYFQRYLTLLEENPGRFMLWTDSVALPILNEANRR